MGVQMNTSADAGDRDDTGEVAITISGGFDFVEAAIHVRAVSECGEPFDVCEVAWDDDTRAEHQSMHPLREGEDCTNTANAIS